MFENVKKKTSGFTHAQVKLVLFLYVALSVNILVDLFMGAFLAII